MTVTLDHNAVSKEYKGRKAGGESEKAKEMVEKALEDKVTSGKIGELRVDPQYLIVGEPTGNFSFFSFSFFLFFFFLFVCLFVCLFLFLCFV
jgi:hypothetical protein